MSYSVLYLDPPWSYQCWKGGSTRTASFHYNAGVMTWEHLAHMKDGINALANPDSAVMLIWMTWPLLPQSMQIVDGWGWEYKTCAFNWVKTSVNRNTFQGLGYYTMSNSEPCMVYTPKRKSAPKRKHKDISQIIEQIEMQQQELGDTIKSIRGRHSAKPDEAYTRIERLFGDVPRIELFARQRRAGWTQIGHELDGLDILDSMEYVRTGRKLNERDFWMQVLPDPVVETAA